jgi:hypothetical protein
MKRRTWLFVLVICLGGARRSSFAAPGDIAWTENFANDPIVAGRFHIPAGHDGSRFTYNGAEPRLTVHYDTILPTAWYTRPIDAASSRTLGLCDDFQFSVTFRVRSAGFFADPGHYAQIGWGLLNSSTTGIDRSGGGGGSYAFDVVAFDYFANVSPLFGGPTLGPVLIHSNTGKGFFGAIEFSFGDETEIDTSQGDAGIGLDTLYTSSVAYDGGSQIATLRLMHGATPQAINANGAGGAGGFDDDPTTTQTFVFSPAAFEVDSFSLMAWQDTFNTDSSSVTADVDIHAITFFAPAFLKGDMNRDGFVNGADIDLFVETLLSQAQTPCEILRADFSEDSNATTADIPAFLGALLTP